MSNKHKEEYVKYLATDYCKAVSEAVKNRDDYRCCICNSRFALQAHHRTYEHRGNELEHLGDLVTLCDRCHTTFHKASKVTKPGLHFERAKTVVKVTPKKTVIVTAENCHLLRRRREAKVYYRKLGIMKCTPGWQIVLIGHEVPARWIRKSERKRKTR